MARNKLSETKIKSLTKPGTYGDGDGLYIRVQKSGSRNWVFIWRRGDERNELGLGGHGLGTAPVSLALAREKADVIRDKLARGEDPRTDRRPHKPKTFLDCGKALIEAKRSEWTGEHTAREWELALLDYAKHLHEMPVADIVLGDVKDCLLPLWTTKQDTAMRLRRKIESAIDYGIAHGWRTSENPARWRGLLEKVMAKPAASGSHHPALHYNQAPEFSKALRKETSAAARAVELVLLTAMRQGVVRNAEWAEVDFKARTWTIPASKMKTKREHIVPLSDRMVDILSAQQQRAVNGFVFPSHIEGSVISESTITKAMRAASPDKAATLHGLRSTFRDWCGDCTDYPREIAESAIAHVVGNEVEQAYRRGSALEKRRQLMTDWQRYLET